MRQVIAQNPISTHFGWNDAIYLPTWNRAATEQDGLNDAVLDRLVHLFSLADQVREFLNAPLIVHVAWRPKAYNWMVGGAVNSAHLAQRDLEAAFDFHVQGMPCSEAIERILESHLLDHLGLRMENNGVSPSWIHLDTRTVLTGHSRYFIP